MLFNSPEFIVFLAIVFALYWLAWKNLRLQNVLLFAAGYVFYGTWDYRFLALLAFSTFLDYFTGLKIFNSSSTRVRKTWLTLSVVANLSFLGFFKYYNFFVDSFASMLIRMGFEPHVWTLQIVLPIGISFYTFHGLSYVFDIYNRKIEPTKNYVDYSVFVCFFPLLVAGPIERAKHLLPQVENPRRFNYSTAVDGLRQMLWGFFKKIVIADKCAEYVDMVFNAPDSYGASTLVLGAIFFSFQIYCDFSGYSDIALGTAKLFGFDLLRNFNYPYFSRDIAEFWRRWHISLTSWFRDYLYYPLGGNRRGLAITIRNTFIVFLVSGFWHGANWTFIVWGFLNALAFMPLLIGNRNRDNIDIVAKGSLLPRPAEAFRIFTTFTLVTFLWIFFRSATMSDALHFITRLGSPSLFQKPDLLPMFTIAMVGLFLMVEWIGREKHHPLALIDMVRPRFVRWSIYYCLVVVVLYYVQGEQQFIYFQF